MALTSGDLVQLGPGGPEFLFNLDPPPAAAMKATRLADSVVVGSTSAVSPTREAGPVPVAAPTPAGVGKATVERMIGFKPGTGGSSGVAFLRAALDLTFFPVLINTLRGLQSADARALERVLAVAALATRPVRDAADAVPELHAAMGGWRN